MNSRHHQAIRDLRSRVPPTFERGAQLGVLKRERFSRGTARRYLEFLADSGSLDLTLRYGAAGRPEHRYRWAGHVGAPK